MGGTGKTAGGNPAETGEHCTTFHDVSLHLIVVLSDR